MLEDSMHNKLLKYSSLKAIQILLVLSDKKEALGITDICKSTGLSAATVHRVVQELMECGFIVKDKKQKQYRIGFESIALAMQIKESDYLVESAKDELRRLNDLTNETVHLISLYDYEGVYIDKMETKNQIGLRSKIGKKLPLYCTGGGKSILAFQPKEWLRDYLKQTQLMKFTDQTITDKNLFFEELDMIRTKGFSIDNREHNPDIICVAAPIIPPSGKVMYSISVSAPDYRFSLDRAISFADEVKKSTQIIAKEIVY